MALKENDDVKQDGDETDISLDMSQAAVKKMIADARERGYITMEQLNAVMPPDHRGPDRRRDVDALGNGHQCR